MVFDVARVLGFFEYSLFYAATAGVATVLQMHQLDPAQAVRWCLKSCLR